MKKTIFIAALLSLSSLAWANDSFSITGGLDPVGGPYSTTSARQDAEKKANIKCAPGDAIRISGWKDQFLQYGNSWLATAEFFCSEGHVIDETRICEFRSLQNFYEVVRGHLSDGTGFFDVNINGRLFARDVGVQKRASSDGYKYYGQRFSIDINTGTGVKLFNDRFGEIMEGICE